jgi:MFS family permease
VIFLHVMGMFVPSFFTGNLITRFGVLNVMFWGAGILLAGVVVALLGLSTWNFRIALTLNGLGWNFLFVGATSLVTTCYRPSERAKAQALNDFLVFGTTATASFLAGFLQERLGWFPLNQSAMSGGRAGRALAVPAAATTGCAAAEPRLNWSFVR